MDVFTYGEFKENLALTGNDVSLLDKQESSGDALQKRKVILMSYFALLPLGI